jgi:hypothetical protein
MAANGVVEFMKTVAVMLAWRDFHALLGAAAAALGAAAALIGSAGASDNEVTTVDLASLCRAAVNCWIWK